MRTQSACGGQGFTKCSCSPEQMFDLAVLMFESRSQVQEGMPQPQIKLNELMKLHVNNLQFTGLCFFAIICMPNLVKKINLLVQFLNLIYFRTQNKHSKQKTVM